MNSMNNCRTGGNSKSGPSDGSISTSISRSTTRLYQEFEQH
jgi:hypothetical protein